jgi:hypothetical protein
MRMGGDNRKLTADIRAQYSHSNTVNHMQLPRLCNMPIYEQLIVRKPALGKRESAYAQLLRNNNRRGLGIFRTPRME